MDQFQINCFVSGEAGARMKALAKSQGISYGKWLTALIMDQPMVALDWQTAVSELTGRINGIEESLQARIVALELADEKNREKREAQSKQDNEVAKHYEKGMVIREIMKAMGIGQQTVYDALERKGLKRKNNGANHE